MAPAPRDEEPASNGADAGGEAELADLYGRWSPLVYSLALRSLGDVAQAEEVTRGVFTEASVSSEVLDPTRTRPRWLISLACRGIAAVQAASGPSAAPTRRDEPVEPESKTSVLAERIVMADGIAHLDTSSQRVLRMALDRDLTIGEIAGRTGLRVEEVRSRIYTSLKELHEQLEGTTDAH